MFSTSKEMIASTPDVKRGMVRVQLRTCLCASALVLAGLAVADPALARSPYDGAWSVTVMTRGGACEPTSRYGVQISNGVVMAGDGGAAVQGRVSPGGAVSVAVQAGGQSASGSGHLNLARGSGVWRGQGSAGACHKAPGWHSASEAVLKPKLRGREDRFTTMLPATTGPATPRRATIRRRPLVASTEPFYRRTSAVELDRAFQVSSIV
jgi:hypothetical protein